MKQFIFILFFLCVWSGGKNNVRASCGVVDDIGTKENFSASSSETSISKKIFECRKQLAVVLTPLEKSDGKIEDRESFYRRTDQKVSDLLAELEGLLEENQLTPQERRFIKIIPLGVKYTHPFPNYLIEEREIRTLKDLGCQIVELDIVGIKLRRILEEGFCSWYDALIPFCGRNFSELTLEEFKYVFRTSMGVSSRLLWYGSNPSLTLVERKEFNKYLFLLTGKILKECRGDIKSGK